MGRGQKRKITVFLLAASLVAGMADGSRLDVCAAGEHVNVEHVMAGNLEADKGAKKDENGQSGWTEEAGDADREYIDANAQEISLEVSASLDDRTVEEIKAAGSVSVSGLEVVKEARKYVGKLKYVSGGTSLTKGADCSGFICRIYEQFGVNIWKHRAQMYKYRTTIGTDIGTDMNKAKAGDIVVYHKHVGLVTERKTVINMQTSKGCREPSYKSIASWAGSVRCIIRPYGVSSDAVVQTPEKPVTYKAPVLNSQSMYGVNATKGYTLSAEVVTAYEITKIEFLAWTDKNGKDDLVASKGTSLKRVKSVTGGTLYSDACKISVADHGNQKDIYHNAVRIYESNGKTTEISLSNADLRAAAGGSCGSGLKWRLTGSGEDLSLYIEGTGAMPDNWVSDGSDTNLRVPWYASRKSIRHVYLSDGITSIGNYAFAEMPITELVLPDSVAVIGEAVCLDCIGLRGTLDLPPSLKKMGARAFLGTNYEALVFHSTGVYASTHDGYYTSNGETVRTHFVDEAKVTLYYPGDGANPTEYAAYYPWTTPTWRGYRALPLTTDIVDFRLDCYSLDLEPGGSGTIGVILDIKGSKKKTITWTTADETIATVDSQGRVTAVKIGDVAVTAKIDGTSMTQECVVHVKGKPTAEIKLTPTDKVLAIGAVLQIEAQVLPESAANKKLHWFSADESIVTVDQNGRATALAAGAVSVVAQAEDGGAYAYCDVKVLPNIDSIRLNKTNITLKSGGTQTLLATLEPENVLSKELIWTSSDESIVKVKDGKVTAIAEGTARIYVHEKSTRSVSAFCEVTVNGSAIAESDRELLGENGSPEGIWVAGFKTSTPYTGKAIKQDIRVYDGAELLAEGRDYKISYKNNIKAASASDAKAPMMILTMKNNFSGKKTLNYTIEKADISQEAFSVEELIAACNGKVQRLTPVLSWNGKKLKAKTDYTVSYPTATQNGAYQAAGTYEVVIQGVGNYTGTRRERLIITDKKPLNQAVIAKIGKQTYTGAAIKPKLRVTYRGVEGTLQEGTDYVVSYSDNTEVGKAVVLITAIGDTYLGSKKVTFDIVAGYSINKAQVTGLPKEVTYTGNELTLTGYTLDYEGTALKEGEDFRVSYKNNNKAGRAVIIFTGIKRYKGTLKKTFLIRPLSVETVCTISGLDQVVYMKDGAKPKPIITDGEKLLKEGTDYTLTYKNNKNVGDIEDTRKQPLVIVKGKGNYTGSASRTFVIQQQDIANLTMTVPDKAYSTKEEKWKSTPVIKDVNGKKLKAGTDYEKEIMYMTVEDWNISPDAGTVVRVSVIGKGAYKGELSGSYHIMLKNISSAKVTVAQQEYTGGAIEPTKENMTVILGKGRNAVTLGNADYDILDYQGNQKKGTGYVVIRGRGNYGGTKKIAFKIGARSILKWWKNI